MREAILT